MDSLPLWAIKMVLEQLDEIYDCIHLLSVNKFAYTLLQDDTIWTLIFSKKWIAMNSEITYTYYFPPKQHNLKALIKLWYAAKTAPCCSYRCKFWGTLQNNFLCSYHLKYGRYFTKKDEHNLKNVLPTPSFQNLLKQITSSTQSTAIQLANSIVEFCGTKCLCVNQLRKLCLAIFAVDYSIIRRSDAVRKLLPICSIKTRTDVAKFYKNKWSSLEEGSGCIVVQTAYEVFNKNST